MKKFKHIFRYLISIIVIIIGFVGTLDGSNIGGALILSLGFIGLYVSTIIKD